MIKAYDLFPKPQKKIESQDMFIKAKNEIMSISPLYKYILFFL